MNGMSHTQYYRDDVERRQQEARAWAEADALGRIARRARDGHQQHPAGTRVLAVASPTIVVLAILAVLM